MPLQLLKYNPGIVKDITEYSAGKNGPFWVDGNLVRFKNGYPQKIGGWQKDVIYGLDASGNTTSTETTINGAARAMVAWRAISDGEDRIAIGTHSHLYIIQDQALYDITPLRKTTSNLTNPLATTDESTEITCTDNSHGALDGDYVVIESAAAIGGVAADTLNRKAGFQISSVTTNTFKITVPSAATSTVSAGGGTTIDFKYLIGFGDKLGAQSSDPALGFGVGGWGEGTWGTARTASDSDVNLENSSWSLNLWGEDLLATLRNGKPYYWDTSGGTGTRASLVSGVSGATSIPIHARISTVSFPDRHFVIGGCNVYGGSGNMDEMLVRWSDQEDFAKFKPSSTNTSGDQRLQIGTKIVAMANAREETLISTDEAIYGMSFVGAPFIFSFRLLSTGTGAAGINTMASVDGNVYWMGKNNFFVYDGIVRENPCPVQYYVFDRMQTRYIDKVVTGHNRKFKEITWFYVSTANTTETDPENDSYVTYNYMENAWSIGSLNRTVWSDSFGARTVPFAFDEDGYLYNHETGTSANGSAMNCHIETSPREIDANGNELYIVDRVIPDATLSSDTSLSLYLNTRKHPQGTETVKGAYTVTSSTTKVSTRAKGRQISLKVQSTGTDDDWSLGDFRVNVRKDGLR
jgi:hypothetical protein